MEKRKANWKGFEPKVKTGYLARYSKLVTNASSGGVMKIIKTGDKEWLSLA